MIIKTQQIEGKWVNVDVEFSSNEEDNEKLLMVMISKHNELCVLERFSFSFFTPEQIKVLENLEGFKKIDHSEFYFYFTITKENKEEKLNVIKKIIKTIHNFMEENVKLTDNVIDELRIFMRFYNQ